MSKASRSSGGQLTIKWYLVRTRDMEGVPREKKNKRYIEDVMNKVIQD